MSFKRIIMALTAIMACSYLPTNAQAALSKTTVEQFIHTANLNAVVRNQYFSLSRLTGMNQKNYAWELVSVTGTATPNSSSTTTVELSIDNVVVAKQVNPGRRITLIPKNRLQLGLNAKEVVLIVRGSTVINQLNIQIANQDALAGNTCGMSWSGMGEFSCDKNGLELQKVCGCTPPGSSASTIWKKVKSGAQSCYQHTTGRQCNYVAPTQAFLPIQIPVVVAPTPQPPTPTYPTEPTYPTYPTEPVRTCYESTTDGYCIGDGYRTQEVCSCDYYGNKTCRTETVYAYTCETHRDPPRYEPPRHDPPPRYEPPRHDPPPRYEPPRHDPPPRYEPPRNDPPPRYEPPRHDPPPRYEPPRNDPPPFRPPEPPPRYEPPRNDPPPREDPAPGCRSESCYEPKPVTPPTECRSEGC